jgi:DNA-binding transcriptional MerR regulator
MNKQEMYGTGEVAGILGIPRWRLLYLLERGVLPEATSSIAGRRLFTETDVERLRAALTEQAKEATTA